MNVPVELVVASLFAVVWLLVMLWAKSSKAGYLQSRLEAAEARYEALYQAYNAEHSLWHRHERPVALGALEAINAYEGDNLVEVERIASDALHAMGLA